MNNDSDNSKVAAGQRFSNRQALNATFLDEAVGNLVGVIQRPPRGGSGSRHTDSEDLEQSLASALAVLSRHFGKAADVFERTTGAANLREIVERFAEARNLVVREVQLKSDWWSAPCGPLLAFRNKTGAVALLLGARGQYIVHDGATGKRGAVVHRAEGKELEGPAFAFYPVLPNEKSSFRGLLAASCTRECWRDLALAALWGMMGGLLGALTTALMTYLVDGVLPNGDRAGLGFLATGWLAAALAMGNFKLSRLLLLSRIRSRIDFVFEAALIKRVLSLPMQTTNCFASGDLTKRIGEASAFVNVVFGAGIDAAFSAGFSFCYLAMVFRASWTLGALVLGMAVVQVLYALFILGLDDKDMARMNLRSVRRQIGAVLQGTELLPGSILSNIVGATGKNLSDAWEAARKAVVDEDIRALPMTMFTLVGERAATISGGQKQRILLARALIRAPSLLVLDEATSALDNTTQANVMAETAHLACTRIVVAHRISTLVHADRILVMDRGRIVQEGTFDELMGQTDGLFRALANRQIAEAGREARA